MSERKYITIGQLREGTNKTDGGKYLFLDLTQNSTMYNVEIRVTNTDGEVIAVQKANKLNLFDPRKGRAEDKKPIPEWVKRNIVLELTKPDA
jgi:hypothetical protein